MVVVVVVVLILIFSLDDLFIDVWYWVCEIWCILIVKKCCEYWLLIQQDLLQWLEQLLVIMVLVWVEYDVIVQMVENMIDVFDYCEYIVFVGIYFNDVEIIVEVECMCCCYKWLCCVEVLYLGLISKVDCLNWLILLIFDYEKCYGIEFVGVILYDSEDVLYLMELCFFNYLLLCKDMIQLLVILLDCEWYELIVGVYMDEFVEWYVKDLVVCESVFGMVFLVGVGMCFLCKVLLVLSEVINNQLFNIDSLIEDYDVGV